MHYLKFLFKYCYHKKYKIILRLPIYYKSKSQKNNAFLIAYTYFSNYCYHIQYKSNIVVRVTSSFDILRFLLVYIDT